MADTIAQPQNQVIQLADVISRMLPAIFGKTVTENGGGTSDTTLSSTGTTNVTGQTGETNSGVTKKVVDPASQKNIDTLLAAIMPQATGTGQADAIVQNILRKATESFAPTLGQQNQVGIHNSSTNELLRNDAIARAVGEASTAVLQSQQQAQKNAIDLVKTSVDANATTIADTTKKADTQQTQKQQEDKKAAVVTTENKTTKTNPLANVANPLSGILTAALVAYGGQKLRKFVSPYLDDFFGSSAGGTLTAANGGIDEGALNMILGREQAGTAVESAGASSSAASQAASSVLPDDAVAAEAGRTAGDLQLTQQAADATGTAAGTADVTTIAADSAVDAAPVVAGGGDLTSTITGATDASQIANIPGVTGPAAYTGPTDFVGQGASEAGVEASGVIAAGNTQLYTGPSEFIGGGASEAGVEASGVVSGAAESGGSSFAIPPVDPFSAIAAVVSSFILQDAFGKGEADPVKRAQYLQSVGRTEDEEQAYQKEQMAPILAGLSTAG